MNTVIGSPKQETKIAEMGDVAHRLFPHIEAIAFKGAFRFAIREALRQRGGTDWGTVVTMPASARRAFFELILKEATPHLKSMGLDPASIEKLQAKLRSQNEKYLIS